VNRFRTIAVTAVAGLVLVACGPAASSSSPETSNEASASAAAASQAQESAGGAEPSFSTGLAADLEALIPDTVAGLPITKTSMLGNEFLVAPTSDPATIKFVQDLGVSPEDISIAIGYHISADATVIIFLLRAAGADTNQLTSAFKEAQNASAGSPIQWSASSLGGKQVEVGDLSGQPTYLYGHGDVLAWVTASTEALAEEAISGLP